MWPMDSRRAWLDACYTHCHHAHPPLSTMAQMRATLRQRVSRACYTRCVLGSDSMLEHRTGLLVGHPRLPPARGAGDLPHAALPRVVRDRPRPRPLEEAAALLGEVRGALQVVAVLQVRERDVLPRRRPRRLLCSARKRARAHACMHACMGLH